MAYATDIINDTFNKTKALFFPIRANFWFKLGFVSMFSDRRSGGGGSGSSGSRGRDLPDNLNFSEAISNFNTIALQFLAQYGVFIGLGFVFFSIISLFFSYIRSIFTFVFIDSLMKKEVHIIKGFKENNKLGANLFFFKLVMGIIGLIVLLASFSPLIFSFFSENLVNFNWWLLIPMILVFILYAFVVGIFFFLVYDFVLPIMYFKKWPFIPAWKHFLKIAGKKKLEIFIYWLLKIALGIASAIISLFVAIPLVLILLLLIGLCIGLFFLLKSVSMIAAAIITGILGFIFLLGFIYLASVVFVPIPSFFTIYSIEMVKKLDPGLGK